MDLSSLHVSLKGEPVLYFAGITITNSLVATWLVMALLLGLAVLGTRRVEVVPTGMQNMWEWVLDGLLGLCTAATPHYARQVFPLIATLFMFIVAANWMGLLPGFNSITVLEPEIHDTAEVGGLIAVAEAALSSAPTEPAEEEGEGGHGPVRVPLLRAANADMNTTLAMAIVAFAMIHASGVRIHGIGGYAKEIATPLFLTPVKVVIECFVPLSLSFRLFGNTFGGEMLLTVISLPVLAVVFMVLEVLFGLIQAIVFAMLTLIFTSLAVHVPEGHGDHGSADQAAAH